MKTFTTSATSPCCKAFLRGKNFKAPGPYRSWVLIALIIFGFSSSFAQVVITSTAGTTSPSNYLTLNAAFTAINAGTHQGSIDISVTGNTTEPATPVPLLMSAAPSNYSSILIKPSGGNWIINSAAAPTASRGIIELNGADNVTIDGNDLSTAGTRNLTFQVVTSTTAGIAAIRLSSTNTSGTDGANNIIIKNCNIIGSRPTAISTVVSYGINMSASSAITTGAHNSINNVFENNHIYRCYHGIFANGNSATWPILGTVIKNNIFGSAVSADNIGFRGIYLANTASTAGISSAIIEGNDIRVGDYTTGYAASVAGIEVNAGNPGVIIRGNNIHDVAQPSSGGWGSYGIHISNATGNTSCFIHNNFIRDITASNYLTGLTSTFQNWGIFITVAATGININHNTIVLNAPNINGTATNVASGCVNITSATAVISSFHNNILVNNLASTNAHCFITSATGNISAAGMNNNNYFANTGNIGFYNGGVRNTLAAWRTSTSKDANSQNVNPTFVSTTDLHINSGTALNLLESAGAPVSATNTSTDFDGQLRPGPAGSVNGGALAPDIGADEFDGVPYLCSTPIAGTTVASPAIGCASGNSTLSLTGSTIIGIGNTYQWQSAPSATGPWTNISGATGSTATVSFTSTTSYRCVVSCATNSSSDISTPATVNVIGSIGGTYTIGATGDFKSLSDAAIALSCGITAPVVFNVMAGSGPYVEQVTIPAIPGSSTINSVIFNGNGNTITFAPSASARHIVHFNGAKHVAFSNFNVVSTDPVNGYGFLLTNNADSNLISNCNINLMASFSNTGTTNSGIVISGSAIGPITAGISGTKNTITGNTIKGGFYGITVIGNSATVNTQGNIITNNTIEDSYNYGIYLLHASTTQITNNNISRPTRTILTTFYGIGHFTSGINNLIQANRIHSPFGGLNGNSTLGAYGIWHSGVIATLGNENKVINNLVYNFTSNGLCYGLQNTGSAFTQYYHNTIELGGSNSTGGAARGFFQTTAATGIDFRNNIISITKGGAGAKHCVFFATTTSSITSNHNVLHLNALATGNGTGTFGTTNFLTLVDWRTANSSVFDLNSISANPQFVNIAQGVLIPTSPLVNDIGITGTGVTQDITAATRGNNPDPGAFEFTPPAMDIFPTALLSPSSLNTCFLANDTLRVRITNQGLNTLNFSTNSFTIFYQISGAGTQTGSFLVNTGTVTSTNFIDVVASTNINLSVQGNYTFNVWVSANWDQQPMNDTLLPVNIFASGVFASASPVSLPSGQSSNLSASSPFLNTLLITEITLFGTGTGHNQPTLPTYSGGTWPDDKLEISNLSTSPINISGISVDFYGSILGTFTFPANTIIPGNGIVTIAMGPGTHDLGNNIY
nr:hypothetical protein [Bacteroidota bacterium]